MFNKIEDIPKEWNLSHINAIYKKGDKRSVQITKE